MNGAPQTFNSRSPPPTILSKTSNFKSHYPNTSPSQRSSNHSPKGVLQDQGLYDLTSSSSSINQGDFTVNTVEEQELPQTPSAMFTADYDPFATYQPSYPNSSAYNMQRGDLAALANSPNSCSVSQRSSFSSAAASTAYSHSDVGPIKNENHLEWPSESHLPTVNHVGDFQSPQSLNLPLGFQDGRNLQASAQSTGFTSPYYGSPSPLSWGRVGSSAEHSADLESTDATGSLQKAVSDAGRSSRQTRKLTTKEEANFQCKVKGCGKLFGRSYNYKAHMETHDAGRVYPYPCPVDGCTRRFVRKTDLQRHNQSVHMKQRDFKCDYCSRYFARKDTLRR